jgi:hypothetical protein
MLRNGQFCPFLRPVLSASVVVPAGLLEVPCFQGAAILREDVCGVGLVSRGRGRLGLLAEIGLLFLDEAPIRVVLDDWKVGYTSLRLGHWRLEKRKVAGVFLGGFAEEEGQEREAESEVLHKLSLDLRLEKIAVGALEPEGPGRGQ